jgi:hypothetical protein
MENWFEAEILSKFSLFFKPLMGFACDFRRILFPSTPMVPNVVDYGQVELIFREVIEEEAKRVEEEKSVKGVMKGIHVMGLED